MVKRERQRNTKIITVRYHQDELKIIDKKRGKLGRSVFVREKSLM